MMEGNSENIACEKVMMEALLTVDELAKKLNVPPSWIYDRTRRSGPERLPHYKLGKHIRFAESEIVDYLRLKAASATEDS